MNAAIVVALVVVVVVIGVTILVIIAMTNGRGGLLDQEKYRTAWLKIENGLDRGNIDSYQFAVMSADKLLDQAMKESGIAGDKMSERLKNGKKKFTNANQVWAAHKVRNQIAHEADTKINELGARRSLSAFKKALKDLGAI